MADAIKISNDLLIENLFVDGDTRTITLKNPKYNIAESQITSLQSYMQANNIIIGDKAGATFGKITKVTMRERTTTSLDITS